MFHANSQNYYLKDLKIQALIDFRMHTSQNADSNKYQ